MTKITEYFQCWIYNLINARQFLRQYTTDRWNHYRNCQTRFSFSITISASYTKAHCKDSITTGPLKNFQRETIWPFAKGPAQKWDGMRSLLKDLRSPEGYWRNVERKRETRVGQKQSKLSHLILLISGFVLHQLPCHLQVFFSLDAIHVHTNTNRASASYSDLEPTSGAHCVNKAERLDTFWKTSVTVCKQRMKPTRT